MSNDSGRRRARSSERSLDLVRAAGANDDRLSPQAAHDLTLDASRAVRMLEAELRQASHCGAVFLVEPGELQPELALRGGCGGAAARDQKTQRHAARRPERPYAGLQCAQLLQIPAREERGASPGSAQVAHIRNASMSAVARSSSAIT